MHMYLDCIPCMIRQGLFAARETRCSLEKQREVLDAIALEVPRISPEASPPEIAVDIYRIIREVTGNDDPFAAVKRKSNEEALAVVDLLLERLAGSSDPLMTAVHIAILGNIIDYGANIEIDLKKEIARILDEEAEIIAHEEQRLFDYPAFRKGLENAREILYLGDNAGEIVFDRVVIETLQRFYPEMKIRFAVRERPVINDVTMEDASSVGMDRVCEVVSSGCPSPGTVPRLCSEEFMKLMNSADMIISKGQGNFEGLGGSGYPVFFLLRVKCPVIASEMQVDVGSVCLFPGGGIS